MTLSSDHNGDLFVVMVANSTRSCECARKCVLRTVQVHMARWGGNIVGACAPRVRDDCHWLNGHKSCGDDIARKLVGLNQNYSDGGGGLHRMAFQLSHCC